MTASRPGVSVVIPTLGGACLLRTIAQVNQGTVVPDEILVCSPAGRPVSLGDPAPANARVIVSEKQGQVAQRIAGFRAATGEFVLQLDDYMYLYEHCLERLLAEARQRGRMCAVSPSFIMHQTGFPCYSVSAHPSTIERMIHGAALSTPGAITRAALNVGLDFSASPRVANESEWLPGGCILHRRENLVLDDYYPFAGKAYGEDVLHSVQLRKRGITLVVVRGALIGIDAGGPRPLSIPGSLRGMRADYRWRRRLIADASGSRAALIADILYKYARRALPALARRIRHGGLFVDPEPPEPSDRDTTVSLSTSASIRVRRKQSSA